MWSRSVAGIGPEVWGFIIQAGLPCFLPHEGRRYASVKSSRFCTVLQGASRPVHDDDEEDDDMDEEDEEVAYQDDEELDAEEDIGVGSMEVHDMHLGGDGAGSLPAAPIAPPEPEPSIARLEPCSDPFTAMINM